MVGLGTFTIFNVTLCDVVVVGPSWSHACDSLLNGRWPHTV